MIPATLLEQTPLAVYILALTLTPGPSALLIASCGARFGFARCTPHLVGALLGFELQLIAAALGIGAALQRHPTLQLVMQLASTAYLLWLGWRLLGTQGANDAKAPPPAPLTWQAAAALQLSNPKPWLTAAASAGLFLPAAATLTKKGVFLLCAGGAGVAGLAAWAVAGMALQRWLSLPSRQAMLHRAMAGALVAAALWGLVGQRAALKPALDLLA